MENFNYEWSVLLTWISSIEAMIHFCFININFHFNTILQLQSYKIRIIPTKILLWRHYKDQNNESFPQKWSYAIQERQSLVICVDNFYTLDSWNSYPCIAVCCINCTELQLGVRVPQRKKALIDYKLFSSQKANFAVLSIIQIIL